MSHAFDHAGRVYIHASAVVIGETGILLRGPSGAGKTHLALALIAEATRDGLFARLVGDDRIGLEVAGGRLLAEPHPAIAGLVEYRFLGIEPIEHEPCCVVGLVVDLKGPLETPPPRLPEAADLGTEVLGVNLARITLMGGQSTSQTVRTILARLAAFRRGS